MIKELLVAGCGGFIGTAGRYLICKWTSQLWHDPFPLGTFLVNMAGCFMIGVFFGILENTEIFSHHHSILLITGFCGGFTTYSAFANEMWVLGSKGDWPTVALYLALSVIIGILCVWAGRAIIR